MHRNIFGCCFGNKALNEDKKKSFILIFRNSLLNFKNNGRHNLKELNTNIAEDFLSKGENPQTDRSLRLKDCSDNVTLLIVYLKTTTNGVKIIVYR